jgi:hypothetical protein
MRTKAGMLLTGLALIVALFMPSTKALASPDALPGGGSSYSGGYYPQRNILPYRGSYSGCWSNHSLNPLSLEVCNPGCASCKSTEPNTTSSTEQKPETPSEPDYDVDRGRHLDPTTID